MTGGKPLQVRGRTLRRPGEAPLDRWSFAHLGTGLGLGLVGVQWWLALALLVAYEVAEALLRRIPNGGRGLFEYESWPNIVADVVVGMVGFMAAAHWLRSLLGLSATI